MGPNLWFVILNYFQADHASCRANTSRCKVSTSEISGDLPSHMWSPDRDSGSGCRDLVWGSLHGSVQDPQALLVHAQQLTSRWDGWSSSAVSPLTLETAGCPHQACFRDITVCWPNTWKMLMGRLSCTAYRWPISKPGVGACALTSYMWSRCNISTVRDKIRV